MAAGLDRATDPKRDANIFYLYTRGASMADIGREYGINPTTVSSIIDGVIRAICIRKNLRKVPHRQDVKDDPRWSHFSHDLCRKIK